MANLSARCKTSKLKKTHDRQRTINVRERHIETVRNLKGQRTVSRCQCECCGAVITDNNHIC